MQNPKHMQDKLHKSRRLLMQCLQQYANLSTEDQVRMNFPISDGQASIRYHLDEIMKVLHLFRCGAPPADTYVETVAEVAKRDAETVLAQLSSPDVNNNNDGADDDGL
jgi:hypothetical protein